MERAVAILPADDVRVAKAFYVGALGFRLQWEAPARDGASGLFGVERSGMAITIDAPMAGHGRRACVSLHVDDADAYHAEWRLKVSDITLPRDEDWGARTFSMTDPSGNTIFVIGPPRSASAARASAPRAVVALAHVADVPRSIAFYEQLGLATANTHTPDGSAVPVWAWLRSNQAQLMIARASEPIAAGQQGVLFYLYVPDVAGFRQRLLDAGLEPGPIEFPFFSPKGEFCLVDPDGYVIMIAHS